MMVWWGGVRGGRKGKTKHLLGIHIWKSPHRIPHFIQGNIIEDNHLKSARGDIGGK
jgi:hypothetical protein